LSDAELKSLAGKDPRVLGLQEAYPHEYISASTVANHTAYNSYASRRWDAQGQLIDDTVELAAGRSIPSTAPIVPTPTPSPAASAALSPAGQRDSQRDKDLRQIQMALEWYYDKEPAHQYPASLDVLVPKYINVLPTDPSTAQPYSYVVNSDNSRDILSAALENPQSPLHELHGTQLGVNCDAPILCFGG
jgi:hypothetical protein